MTRIAIVGATGAVGREVAALLPHSALKSGAVRCFASARSAEKKATVRSGDREFAVEDLRDIDFNDFDLAIFSAGSKISKAYAPLAKDGRCVVIDNSSAFRMDPSVPLVVPEINSHTLRSHTGVIANPNCTTAITLMALYPLHLMFGVQRIIASTYQAASGAGAKGLEELDVELAMRAEKTASGETDWEPRAYSDVFPHPIAMNVFPHVGTFVKDGPDTDEELKMQNEGAKILGLPSFQASTTCVRVPVARVHCIDVLAQFESDVNVAIAYDELRNMKGLDVMNGNLYPTPLMYAGRHPCAIGRLRADERFPKELRFWVAGDQILKGAALNAVQIAERLVR